MKSKWLAGGLVMAVTCITWAAVPDTSATVTRIGVGNGVCRVAAVANASGEASSAALAAMGIASITIKTMPYYNNDLTKAPHTGAGNGSCTATQVATCSVVSDSTGKVTTSLDVDNSKTTVMCDPLE